MKLFESPLASTGGMQSTASNPSTSLTKSGPTLPGGQQLDPPTDPAPQAQLQSGSSADFTWRVGQMVEISSVPLLLYNQMEWDLTYVKNNLAFAKGAERKLIIGGANAETMSIRTGRIKIKYRIAGTGFPQVVTFNPPAGVPFEDFVFLRVTQSYNDNSVNPSELDIAYTGAYPNGVLMADSVPGRELRYGLNQKAYGQFQHIVVMCAYDGGLFPAQVRLGGVEPFRIYIYDGPVGADLTFEIVDDRNDARVQRLVAGSDAAMMDALLLNYGAQARTMLGRGK